MANKLRVEFVRLRSKGADFQTMTFGDAAPVTKAVSGTALTTTGKVSVPASVNGQTRFHARCICDVDVVVTAGADPADTSLDATLIHAKGILVPANTPILIPVEGGWVMSAITGPYA